MNYEQAIKHFGGCVHVARALGIDNKQTVHYWRGRRIPSKWQMKIESLTRGKLRADEDARKDAAEMAALLGR